jgi:hypothetical protein
VAIAEFSEKMVSISPCDDVAIETTVSVLTTSAQAHLSPFRPWHNLPNLPNDFIPLSDNSWGSRYGHLKHGVLEACWPLSVIRPGLAWTYDASFTDRLPDHPKHIVTVEDPIEYQYPMRCMEDPTHAGTLQNLFHCYTTRSRRAMCRTTSKDSRRHGRSARDLVREKFATK